METETLKTYLTHTLRRLLRPIIRIALRGELTYKDFADIAKLAYFDVAREDFGINGRPTNLARVAILTGLSRKECTRLKSLDENPATTSQTMNPATRVITAWHEDLAFQDASGKPRDLPMDGTEPSLSDLLRRYGGDIPAGALMTELKRIGAIESPSDGTWRVVKRSFIAEGFDQEKVRILGNQLSDLGATIVHNVAEQNAPAPRMQRYVVADALHPDDAQEFQRVATRKGQALLEELDAWISTHARSDASEHKHAQRAGLGMYFFQNSISSGVSK